MIAFFHTHPQNIERFDNLMKIIAPNQELKHFLNEAILKDAILKGEVTISTANAFRNEVLEISKLNPQLLICTCSTFGEECKNLNSNNIDIKRIDYPIAKYLVNKYSKIGLAFSAKSTQNISRNLLLEIAADLNKQIEIIDIDCTKSWNYFKEGKLEDYNKSIAKNIQLKHLTTEAIFIAQASMEGAKVYLNIEKEVVTSPAFGLNYFLKGIQNDKEV
ncbi:MAG: hypothetical protein PF541_11555 [Prolixibacteraceae bacterium]|jgi:hypothetical protein|nr:hypothetical protein [Prolixibacteraceae bacterium]